MPETLLALLTLISALAAALAAGLSGQGWGLVAFGLGLVCGALLVVIIRRDSERPRNGAR